MSSRTALAAVAVCVVSLATFAVEPASQPSTHADNIPTTCPDFLEQSNRQLLQREKELQELSGGLPPPATQASPVLEPSTAAVTEPSTTSSEPQLPSQRGSMVVSSELEENRSGVPVDIGTGSYTLGQAQIAATPGGENASFQQVLLRSPGVVEDSFGQVHVRGEHGNLTYRLDGIFLPQGLEGFGQQIDTRLIDSSTLIDGALPAQFGFRTAGVVDITPKSGKTLNSNELSFYGGSRNTLQPSAQFGGTVGKLDYFAVISSNQNSLGVENTTSGIQANHDRTDLTHFFTFLSNHLDDTSQIDLIINASNQDFQIPDTPGVSPAFPLAGHPNALRADSINVDENQNEQVYYGILAYKKTLNAVSVRAAVYTQYASIHFIPDPVNDLIFQGVASDVRNTFLTNGAQFDTVLKLNDQHTLRAGFLGYYTNSRLESDTAVFATDPATGAPVSDVPVSLSTHSGNHGVNAGIYVEDEWRLTKKLTLNSGLRYDRFDADFLDAGQLSPRVNLVYQFDTATTFHLGYSRYFVPPPYQYVGPGVVDRFSNTTNAPGNNLTGALKPERSNYYDVGLERQIAKSWKLSADAFFKDAHNLLDDGQFGAPVIITPFNYRLGQVWGAELSSSYTFGGLSLYGNFAYVNTLGNDIISQQYLIANDELAYIHNHWIKLDHEGEYTASIGISYRIKDDLFSIDALYGSGLRRGFANTGKEPEYFPVNLSWEHDFHLNGSSRDLVKLRFDIVNLFDESYQLRDGSGIGVAAPQYGARRAFYGGLSYVF